MDNIEKRKEEKHFPFQLEMKAINSQRVFVGSYAEGEDLPE